MQQFQDNHNKLMSRITSMVLFIMYVSMAIGAAVALIGIFAIVKYIGG